MTTDLAAMRRQYTYGALLETEAPGDPFGLFADWFEDARESSTLEANAMVLATVDQHGIPSARTVLLKSFDERGFVFYTNYTSKKGRDIGANPAVAAVFNWPTHERQVRITGTAELVSPAESDAYFASRPRGSQVGAAASPQSEPVIDRAWLEARFARFAEGEEPLERPPEWGGYRIVARSIEFWQGRQDRLHDRLRYDRLKDHWDLVRLAP